MNAPHHSQACHHTIPYSATIKAGWWWPGNGAILLPTHCTTELCHQTIFSLFDHTNQCWSELLTSSAKCGWFGYSLLNVVLLDQIYLDSLAIQHSCDCHSVWFTCVPSLVVPQLLVLVHRSCQRPHPHCSHSVSRASGTWAPDNWHGMMPLVC